MVKVSCIQTSSTTQMDRNIAEIGEQVQIAAAQGSQFVALPENAFLMAAGAEFYQQIYAEAEHPALQAAISWARDLKIWLLVGSIAIKGEGSPPTHEAQKMRNRSYLLSPQGIHAFYDKIHLFDVSIPGGESHQESARFAAGNSAVITETPWAKIGMSICYDVRFPQLYRTLAKAGAEILTVPAAFTRFTGEKGGWHVLNRARAMENGCFVIAPAQCGQHGSGRQTYGHSLIINPWGEILAEAGESPCILSAEIDMAEVARIRQIMPSLQHDREFRIDR